jgi:hypothetical protein
VLVSLHDVTPVVKVIDFGVAKAIGGRLTDKTVYTQLTQLIWSPRPPPAISSPRWKTLFVSVWGP